MKSLHRLAREVEARSIRGDFVECGVYRGGTAAILARVLRDSKHPRRLWLFDSFKGIPSPRPPDGPDLPLNEGDLAGEEAIVRSLLAHLRVPEDRYHVIPGWFSDTFPQVPIQEIALLHIDVGLYEGVKLALEHFYDRVVPGGVIILGAFLYEDMPGSKVALEEFADLRGLQIVPKDIGNKVSVYFHKAA